MVARWEWKWIGDILKSFQRVQTADRTIGQLQDNLGKAITDLGGVPLNSGILLEAVVLASGSNTVYTTLPVSLTGWFIVRQNAAATFYDGQDTNTNPATLVLIASGAVTASIFVF